MLIVSGSVVEEVYDKVSIVLIGDSQIFIASPSKSTFVTALFLNGRSGYIWHTDTAKVHWLIFFCEAVLADSWGDIRLCIRYILPEKKRALMINEGTNL